MSHTSDTSRVELRPYRRLLISGIVARLALSTPVLAVGYWLTIRSGEWRWFLLLDVFVVLVNLAMIRAFFKTRIVVDARGVHERGFFGRTSCIHPGQVKKALLVDIYRHDSTETLPNLFVIGTSGRSLLRMRGLFWSKEDMRFVAERLGAELREPSAPITRQELRFRAPQVLYWFERFPPARLTSRHRTVAHEPRL